MQNSTKKRNGKKVVNEVIENITVNEVMECTIEKIENDFTELVTIELTQAEKNRIANPQFSHLVSKIKKVGILETKQSLKSTFLLAKKDILRLKSELNLRDVSFIENLKKHEEGIKFTNFVLNGKNQILLNKFDDIVKKDKNNLYTEYRVTQAIQKMVKYVIEKNLSYDDAINFVLALQYQDKKDNSELSE